MDSRINSYECQLFQPLPEDNYSQPKVINDYPSDSDDIGQGPGLKTLLVYALNQFSLHSDSEDLDKD
jgi:hypothetical protein